MSTGDAGIDNVFCFAITTITMISHSDCQRAYTYFVEIRQHSLLLNYDATGLSLAIKKPSLPET